MMLKNPSFFSNSSTILLLLGALLVLLVPMKTTFNLYDEGFAVVDATRVLNGDVPYKDFWAIYPPGQSLTLAALFKVFGTSLLVARIYDTLVRFCIVLAVWWIAKKITSRALAYLAVLAAAFLLGSAGFYSYAVFPALALCLVSILSLLAYVETQRGAWLGLTGVLIGLAACFRWDIGLYAAVSVGVTLLLFHLGGDARHHSSLTRGLFAARALALLIGAALIVLLPFYGSLSIVAGFSNVWEQIILFPLTTLREVRWRPYPMLLPPLFALGRLKAFVSGAEMLTWLQFYFPLAVYGIAFFYYGYAVFYQRVLFTSQTLGRIVVAIFGALLFAQALSRFDFIHTVPTLIVSALVVVSLVAHTRFNFVNRVLRFAPMLLLPVVILLYIYFPARGLVRLSKEFSPFECYSQLERASCIALVKNQAQAVEYLRAHTQQDEFIFVGNQSHDRIFVNDVAFYFLSARASASRYHELFPGVATTLPVQQEIARDIAANQVKWIVLVNMPASREPNASAVSSGVHYLDNFIRANYARVAEFGNYQIWEKQTQ